MDALVSGIMLLPAPNLLVASGLHRQPRSAVFVGFNSAEALSRGKPALERTFKMGSDDVGRGADQQHRFEVLLGVERKVLQEGIDSMGIEHEHPVAAIRR